MSDINDLSGIQSRPRSGDYISRLICLTQNHSCRPLNISAAMLRCLMLEHDIRPEFLDLVSSFGQKVVKVEESLCIPLQMFENDASIEYMYVFKYAEETGRAADPWAVRQSALYHQLRLSNHQSTYVLISPYTDTPGQAAVIEWFKAQHKGSECRLSAFSINSRLMSCYVDGCRGYTKYFERRIEDMSLRMHGLGVKESDCIAAKDMVELNYVNMRLVPIDTTCQTLLATLNGLRRTFEHCSVRHPGLPMVRNARQLESIESCTHKATAYQTYAEAVLRKTACTVELLNGILNFNNQNITHQLTTTTLDDSTTVRVITAITLTFLSFTAVAAVMAMPLFHLDDSDHLAVSPSFWVYIAVAIPLTLVTMVFWRVLVMRKRRSRSGSIGKSEGV